MIILFYFISVFDYSLGLDANFAYDNNIFDYSQKYLNEFTQQIHPERFPFETCDDLITDVDVSLTLRNKFINNRTTTFNLRLYSYNYVINQEKDYQLFSGGIRQSFGKYATKFEYLFIPRYLIRYFQDPTGNVYIGCEFTEHLFTWKNTFSPNGIVSFGISLKREIDNYIENFYFYNSRANRLEFYLDIVLAKFFEPSLEYEYKDSKARGPSPDISFQQHMFKLSNIFRLKFPRLSKVNLDYQFKYRFYTTEASPVLDSPHSGRDDITHLLKLGWEFPVFTMLSLSVSYSYEVRTAYSDVYLDLGDYKNYRKSLISAGIEFIY